MPKIDEELIEEAENLEEENIEGAPPIEEEIDEEEYSVDPALSLKQRILLFIGGFFTFLFFLILLFPLEEFIKSAISKTSSQSGYFIDFKKLKIPVFGSKTVDSLTIQTPEGFGLKTEEIEMSSSIFNLIGGNFSGNILVNSLKLDKQDISLNLKSLYIEGKLTGITEGLGEINGNLIIGATNGSISKIPVLPLVGELQDTKIKNISINLKFKNGKIQIEKGVLDTSIGKIIFKGKFEYISNFKNSKIDMELCPKLSASFAAERPDLSDMLQVISKGNSEFCIPVGGTVDMPKVNISLTGENPPVAPTNLPTPPALPVPAVPVLKK